ncbi:DUF58 domain-containing protein [Arthrobacter gandavensis]|uniref:DUF58 domain-containing protein n=1 Tax=Arthrobacter gandavensis TaxID=169960 RepID=UPI00188E188B|nr:DUF58 domain-containing protein [Arthrobacter gandavensis]MBF4993037.1 DUF58 domain-containing protein [Arthrobacter gandavensis]
MKNPAQLAASRPVLTGRGWGLVAAGVVSLLGAQVLGRRDLLLLGVFLVLVPLASALALRLLKPHFSVQRTFRPPSAETGTPVSVGLAVQPVAPFGGTARMTEELPSRFGTSPEFSFPAARSGDGQASRYEYRLTSSRRGLYRIGPVSAGFLDPFGLALARHTIGDTDNLVVKPVPVELPAVVLDGLRGSDGSVSTRVQGVPSQDDVTTREYRHGDPMRRVHWSATARRGELMVRQEETVATPRATLVLDQRESSYDQGFLSPFWAEGADDAAPASSESFEWAVSAVMSIGSDLLERGFALRLLDTQARPGLQRSPSSPDPDADSFSGAAAAADLGEGLAALGLEEAAAASGSRPLPGARARHILRRSGGRASAGTRPRSERSVQPGPQQPFGDALLEALLDARSRGPLVVITGALSEEDARRLAPAADAVPSALALVVTERPAASAAQLRLLRAAGWTAEAVVPSQPVAAAWSGAAERAAALAPPGLRP